LSQKIPAFGTQGQCHINNSSKCSNCYKSHAFGGPTVFCNVSYLSHYTKDFFQSKKSVFC